MFSEIYRRDHSARLLQMGEGELTEQMKEKCRSLNIEDAVIFAGARSDVEKYYSGRDVVAKAIAVDRAIVSKGGAGKFLHGRLLDIKSL